MAIRRLGQILVDLGYINDEQLKQLLEEQAAHPSEKIGKLAEEMGLITDEQLTMALAEQFNMQVCNLGEIQVPREVVKEINDAMAQMYKVVPIKLEDNQLTVATSSRRIWRRRTSCGRCSARKSGWSSARRPT